MISNNRGGYNNGRGGNNGRGRGRGGKGNNNLNCQNSVLQKHNELMGAFNLEEFMIEKEKMHFTMFVLTLETQDDIKECSTLFQSCKEDIVKMVDTNLGGSEFSFKLSGVHTFEDVEYKKGRVVFSGPEFTHTNGEKTFCEISSHIHQLLKNNSVTVDKNVNDKIHCTLAKSSKVKDPKAPKALPEYVYRHEQDTIFGNGQVEVISEILLCRMKGPNAQDGFYHIEDRILITK